MKKTEQEIDVLIEESEYSKLVYFLLKNTKIKTISHNDFIKELDLKISQNNLFRIVGKYLIKYRMKMKFKDKKINFIGCDHIFIGNVLLGVTKNFKLIEDGTENYNSKNFFSENYIKKKIKETINFNRSFGQHKNVKKIYLTGLAPIPKEIAHKVEIINLKELWDKKSLEEQNKILDIFSFDLNIKEIIKGRDIILFTQPLSEDGVITEEEKIEIYSKIVKKYPQDRLIVKTHPREKTNYKKIFKYNLVLDNPFPFEMLNLLNVKFNKAVTLFSTAALGLGKDVTVDFYGTEVNDKILARFGSCDNIMKRNCRIREEENE